MKTFTTNAGKGIVDETSPFYCGVYNGEVATPGIKKAVESSDFVLNIGPLLSDSNTGAFTRDIKDSQLVRIDMNKATVAECKVVSIHY